MQWLKEKSKFISSSLFRFRGLRPAFGKYISRNAKLSFINATIFVLSRNLPSPQYITQLNLTQAASHLIDVADETESVLLPINSSQDKSAAGLLGPVNMHIRLRQPQQNLFYIHNCDNKFSRPALHNILSYVSQFVSEGEEEGSGKIPTPVDRYKDRFAYLTSLSGLNIGEGKRRKCPLCTLDIYSPEQNYWSWTEKYSWPKRLHCFANQQQKSRNFSQPRISLYGTL